MPINRNCSIENIALTINKPERYLWWKLNSQLDKIWSRFVPIVWVAQQSQLGSSLNNYLRGKPESCK